MAEVIPHIESLINHGRFLEARSAAEELLRHSADLRGSQLYALALSKSGAPESAKEYLEPHYRAHHEDPETAGILGSIYKELFKRAQQTSFALLSRDTYLKNFELTRSYYTGINAASMSAMLMQGSKARQLATEVLALIPPETSDFWELATLGEAYLLLKEKTKSVEYYLKARRAAGTDWGKMISVHNQLWLLNHYVPVSADVLKVFSPPSVVAFVGHMIDHPSRSMPRFPASIEPQVKSALVSNIRALQARVGYCSLACGSDILFAEALAEAGGEVNLFLPFREEDFVEVSVRFAGDAWLERYHSLRSRFPVTFTTEGLYDGNNDLFTFQSKIIFGSAYLRSAMFHTEPRLITVLSELDLKRSTGGTRDTLRLWPTLQNHVNINPDAFLPENVDGELAITTVPESQRADPEFPLCYVVLIEFEGVIPLVKEKVIKHLEAGLTSNVIRQRMSGHVADSTVLALVYESAAVDFILKLMELGSPTDKSMLKVTLHAGPVTVVHDTFSGNSVAVLQDISRFSPRGSVCASMQVATVLTLDARFTVEYAGLISGAGSASHAVYRVGYGKFSV